MKWRCLLNENERGERFACTFYWLNGTQDQDLACGQNVFLHPYSLPTTFLLILPEFLSDCDGDARETGTDRDR